MKGQQALEFLMTYGWAILIVVVVVGALFAMNIINPTSFKEQNETLKYKMSIDNAKLDCDCTEINNFMDCRCVLPVNIPSKNEVDKFCKNLDYEFGWLNSECELNQVMCHKEQDGLVNNTCVLWV